MSDWDYYNELLEYMKDVGRNLDNMIRSIDECERNLHGGLAINGKIYKEEDLNALRSRIENNKNKIWDTVVPTLIDDMNSL